MVRDGRSRLRQSSLLCYDYSRPDPGRTYYSTAKIGKYLFWAFYLCLTLPKSRLALQKGTKGERRDTRICLTQPQQICYTFLNRRKPRYIRAGVTYNHPPGITMRVAHFI